MSFAARVDDILLQQGEVVIYTTKVTSSRNLSDLSKAVTTTDYTIKAHFRAATDKPIAGQLAEDVRQVRIAAKALSITPKRGDVITKATGEVFEVIKVDTRYGNGENIIHILNVQGS